MLQILFQSKLISHLYMNLYAVITTWIKWCHFADIFKSILLNKNSVVVLILLDFVPVHPITSNNKSALVQVMVSYQPLRNLRNHYAFRLSNTPLRKPV